MVVTFPLIFPDHSTILTPDCRRIRSLHPLSPARWRCSPDAALGLLSCKSMADTKLKSDEIVAAHYGDADGHVGKMHDVDELRLAQMGHKQELARHFGVLSLIGLASTTTISWTGMLGGLIGFVFFFVFLGSKAGLLMFGAKAILLGRYSYTVWTHSCSAELLSNWLC